MCRARLKPGEFAGIVKTFNAVFPHATVWLGHSHGVLLGSPSPLAVDFKISLNFSKL
ncbi:MAG: hypothetical protein QME74_04435 [Candidatus Edwardsbacteria bacterium]|nr:hypothetical protein [Candidatus Edwardsbacteria bacterium]